MALKQEIILWDEAVKYHDTGYFEKALNTFNEIADTSRILFNCGVIHASLGEHAEAVDFYHRAIARDQYLAVAYFQCGVSNFLLGEFEAALANFNDTISCLRGNLHIDYDQLGLRYKLHFCEALFNRGLCYIYLQQKALGMQDLRNASTKKVITGHNVIDEAIDEEAEGFVVFSIPRGIIYRPNAAKVKNLTSKDYLGKARLIAAQQDRRNQSAAPAIHTRRPLHGRNHSETALSIDLGRERIPPGSNLNISKPGLSFRSRQQSEPPRNRRDLFPPTPPPDELTQRRGSNDSKRNSTSESSVRSWQEQRAKPKPSKLDLGHAAFGSGASQERLPVESQESQERPRLGNVRSASEQPRAKTERGTSSTREERRQSHRRSLRVDTHEESYTLKPDIYAAVHRSLSQQQQQQAPQQLHPPTLQPVTYNQHRSKSKARLDTHRPVSIEEECEDDNEDSEEAHPDSAISGIGIRSIPPLGTISHSVDEPTHLLPFEILAASTTAPQSQPQSSRSESTQRRHVHSVNMTKIRIKVHGDRDTRYVMISPSTTFPELLEQVKRKFGLLCWEGEGSGSGSGSGTGTVGARFRLGIRDEEGDMVTMGDQEDLEMAVLACRDGLVAAAAARNGGGVGGDDANIPVMGKMEIWVREI
ncbi:hypothetical protein BDV97DRAFT_149497 [Delphinella strobiligena]|nr:hypothetical protein BDV97DRAFT_149497 [Delphinella strobiligena]